MVNIMFLNVREVPVPEKESNEEQPLAKDAGNKEQRCYSRRENGGQWPF